MRAFKMKNLFAVLLVSASVLLTGCNIEALGNFGKATEVLEEYNVVFDNSYNECLVNRDLRYATELAKDLNISSHQNSFRYVPYKNVVFCLEYKKSDREFKKVNDNLVVLGKMLAKIESDANVTLDEVKGYATALKTLNDIKIIESPEPDSNSTDNSETSEKPDLGKEQLKEVITGVFGKEKDDVNKLTGILKSVARGIYKALAKKKLVEDISQNLLESNESVLSSVKLLKKVIEYYKFRTRFDLEANLKLAEATIFRIRKPKKVKVKNTDCKQKDLEDGKCKEFVMKSPYIPSKETVKMLEDSYLKAANLYGSRTEKLNKFDETLDKFLVAHKKLIEKAEDKKGLKKKRFDGDKFKSAMLNYLQEAFVIFAE